MSIHLSVDLNRLIFLKIEIWPPLKKKTKKKKLEKSTIDDIILIICARVQMIRKFDYLLNKLNLKI